MKKNNDTIETKIMDQIQCGKVKLRSRYLFWAENFGLRSIFILSILSGVLAFTLVLFYLRATDNLLYLSFGKFGIYAFLESFPYLLVIGFIFFIFFVGYIIKKSDLFYTFPFGYSSVSLLCVMVIAGAALAYTHIPEFIEEEGYRSQVREEFMRPFFHNNFFGRNHGIIGEIRELQESAIIVQTPDGIARIDYFRVPSIGEISSAFEVGKFVIIVGEREGDVFHAQVIQLIDKDKVPMIHRRIRHRFPRQSLFLPQLHRLFSSNI